MTKRSDYLILGGGVMGLAVARAIKLRRPSASVTILEKEKEIAAHASGRNSGVLHAGFYYGADSLKARFCREGNAAWRDYVARHNLRINDCKKVVVTTHEVELEGLDELYRRGQVNGVDLKMIDEKELAEIEPNAKTVQRAIYSPTTAIVDPVACCHALKKELLAQGVIIETGRAYLARISGNAVQVGIDTYEAGHIINCAGLYADKVARDFGFCDKYAIVPFKGVYLKYKGIDMPAKPCIYPVPNIRNPFLGVHFSVTVDGTVKIGPTAIPAFWRENYRGLSNFSAGEMAEILWREALMFLRHYEFRAHAWREIRKYNPRHMAKEAARMVKRLDIDQFTGWSKPGIRAQLIDLKTLTLLHDFVVEGDKDSTHVLNAVSPAFTSSLPFAQWIVDERVLGNRAVSGA